MQSGLHFQGFPTGLSLSGKGTASTLVSLLNHFCVKLCKILVVV